MIFFPDFPIYIQHDHLEFGLSCFNLSLLKALVEYLGERERENHAVSVWEGYRVLLLFIRTLKGQYISDNNNS